MFLVNVPTTSLLDRVRNILKGREAKPKINLRRFESNFPEQRRVQPLNQVTNLETCLVSLWISEFVNLAHVLAQHMHMTHNNEK